MLAEANESIFYANRYDLYARAAAIGVQRSNLD